MSYVVIALAVLYLCGVKVGIALAISSIILSIISIILSEMVKREI